MKIGGYTKTVRPVLWALLFLFTFGSLPTWGQVYFVPNAGQWEGDFAFRATIGDVDFVAASSYLGFYQTAHIEDEHPSLEHAHPAPNTGHYYRLEFLGGNAESIEALDETSFYYNYIVGDRSTWRSGLHPSERLLMKDVYDGVDVLLYSRYGQLKYDILVEDADDLDQVRIRYNGVDSLRVIDGRLHSYTSLGEMIEIRPYAYVPDSKKPVTADYHLEGDVVSFDIDPRYDGPLVLDPTFIFSSFTGSNQDNWGFSATYHPVDSTVYVAGITRDGGLYPTTPGAIDSIPNGANDIAISKFSADGKQMLYATYLGGGSVEMPSSLVVDSAGRLVVLGSTGSGNFPIPSNGYDTTLAPGATVSAPNFTYGNGSDAFVVVLENDGRSLYGGTYMGGSGVDGINMNLRLNYGDEARGEVVLSKDNTILVVTTTGSSDIPLVNESQSALAGNSDAWLFELPLECDTVLWSTYFGGVGNDAGFGIRESSTGLVYACGITVSNTLPGATGNYQPNNAGLRDGYIVRFGSDRTSPISTFNGTLQNDANFLIALDSDDHPYVFGQTLGTYPTSTGVISEPNASLFVHEFAADLSSSHRSLAFGNGRPNSLAISPTAFSVDECGDVYLSGWGGSTNLTGTNSTTNGMAVTTDAFQSTTDGSDLYFAVIDASFTRLNYATFFGGVGAAEHVDGGTSRFDSRGVMYQAICAGCGGSDNYPTFPSDVHSTTNNSGNCNLAVTVIAFDQQRANIDLSVPDTVCTPFQLQTTGDISGADWVIWDFGGGDIDTSMTLPQRQYVAVGSYSVTIIALDTNCQTSDTAVLEFEVVDPVVDGDFQMNYDPCSSSRTVSFVPSQTSLLTFIWDFGDGNRDTTTTATQHTYAQAGTYTVTVIATATNCFGTETDTVTQTIIFTEPTPPPTIDFSHNGCGNTGLGSFSPEGPGWHVYRWSLSTGDTIVGEDVGFNMPYGTYTVELEAWDTVCNRYVVVSEVVVAQDEVLSYEGQIPNVFTPDNNGVNDYFQFVEGFQPASFEFFSMKVYNRWGQLLFESGDTQFKWDGTFEGRPLPEGVYFWIANAQAHCGSGMETKGVVHITREE